MRGRGAVKAAFTRKSITRMHGTLAVSSNCCCQWRRQLCSQDDHARFARRLLLQLLPQHVHGGGRGVRVVSRAIRVERHVLTTNARGREDSVHSLQCKGTNHYES